MGRVAFRVKRPPVSEETIPKHMRPVFAENELISNVISVEFQSF